jgi:hypothetical protein
MPQTHHSPLVTQQGITTPPPPRTCHPTTSPHLPQSQFPAAHPKPSPGGSLSSFWPNPPPPRLRDQTRHHHTATTLYAPSNHLPTSLPTAIPRGVPVTEHLALDFGFQAQIPPARLRDPTQHHHTTTTAYTPSHHLPPSPPTAIPRSAPKT